MLESACLEVDVRKPESMKLLLPVAPIFSNAQSAQALVPLDHHCQPVWETPSFYSLQHIITIFVGQPTQVHQVVGRNTQQATYTAGKVGIYPAYESRSLSWDREAEFIDLYLAPETIARYADTSFDAAHYDLISQLATGDLLIYSLGLAIKELTEQSICDRFYIESALTMLIAHLLRHYSVRQNLLKTQSSHLTTAKFNQVIDYIQTHLDCNPSLVELATLVDLSACHFVRVFKGAVGVTPHQYLLMCRIDKAQHLLAQKHLSLAEIAQQVGFYDQSRFTSVFRKRIGITPKQYRDRL
jgi:AraC family transcriptional regulator